MKLIREEINQAEYIIEADNNGKKSHKIKGIFMQANIKNRNGRVYPQEVLEKEVNRYNKEFVEKKRAFGELGHPDGPTVNLERVSHIITKLEGDNKGNYIGEAKITDTPYGKIVKSLIDEGAQLGVSSRGMGSLENKGGTNYVKSDFYLATAADIVADPSAPQAFVNGVMEGKEWVWDNGIIKEQDVSEIQDQINRARRDEIAKAQTAAFNNFMQKLTKI
jgi:hypothetical protein